MWALDTCVAYGASVGVITAFPALLLLRGRALSRHDRTLLDERLLERERIVRLLHDTLFQKVDDLLLAMETFAGAAGLSDHDRGRLAHMGEGIREAKSVGCNAVFGVHREALRHGDLLEALGDMTPDSATYPGVTYAVRVDGQSRAMRREVREEVVAIARESIVNALKHAGANHIGISLRYEAATFTMDVVDDGAGIASEYVSGRRCEGHWGIAGMHERATKIGGVLAIAAIPPRGTRVELVLAEHAAYATKSVD